MKYFLYILIVLWFCSCKKFLDIKEVPGRMLTEDVFSNDSLANRAVSGIYAALREVYNSPGSPTIISGLAGDELASYSSTNIIYNEYKLNDVKPTNAYLPWPLFYNVIYQVNAAVEGIEKSNSLSEKVRKRLLGEVKTIRAYCYFNLVNFFGDVPLLLSTDINRNSTASREQASKVYEQIIMDLNDAVGLLDENEYNEKYKFNFFAAKSLLARVYLFCYKWDMAEQESSFVINSGKYQLLSDLDSFSVSQNSESIFQFSEGQIGNNLEIEAFLPLGNPNVILAGSLISSFEPGDIRREQWTNSVEVGSQFYYYPFKYRKSTTDEINTYNVVRLAEQYLIRAEARAKQGNYESSVDDLNVIRMRAHLPAIINVTTEDSCMSLILKERRLELFAETGHRWMDIKRAKQIDDIILKEKGKWNAIDSIFPIPLLDIQRNPNLIQNPY